MGEKFFSCILILLFIAIYILVSIFNFYIYPAGVMSLFKSEKMWRHCYFIVLYSSIEMFYRMRVRILVLNVTFNNISVVSCWLFLLVEETGEKHRSAESQWQTLSQNVLLNTPCHELFRMKSKRNKYNGCVIFRYKSYFASDILVETDKLIIRVVKS